MKLVRISLVTTAGAAVEEDLILFNSRFNFLRKIKKHVCNPREPWKLLLQKSDIDRWCTKVVGEPPMWQGSESEFEAAYEELTTVLVGQVSNAATAPLYIEYKEWKASTPNLYEVGRIYLASTGLIAVSRHDRIVSAYFRPASPPISPMRAFTDAWHYLKDKCRDREQTAHMDSRAHDYCGQYTYVAPQSWAVMPVTATIAPAAAGLATALPPAQLRPTSAQLEQLREFYKRNRENCR